ncbi:MAG: gamma-glutamyl-gamma-aminobutyrate hydrolase family protein [Alphaproteobacteria bacterium]|nr:gamma-glutamyl-gamma-aminobutyrate hydrolase family protein [Alphaproteobacteria bacterium]
MVESCDIQPVILSPLPNPLVNRTGFSNVIGSVDGVFLIGSILNIAPKHYGKEPLGSDAMHDPGRDATALEGIPKIVAAGLPLLGICRGMQEINVAYGSSLH